MTVAPDGVGGRFRGCHFCSCHDRACGVSHVAHNGRVCLLSLYGDKSAQDKKRNGDKPGEGGVSIFREQDMALATALITCIVLVSQKKRSRSL